MLSSASMKGLPVVVYLAAAAECHPHVDVQAVVRCAEENSLLQRYAVADHVAKKVTPDSVSGTSGFTGRSLPATPVVSEEFDEGQKPDTFKSNSAVSFMMPSRRWWPGAQGEGHHVFMETLPRATWTVERGERDAVKVIVFILFSILMQAILAILIAYCYLDTVREPPGKGRWGQKYAGADLGGQWSSSLVCDSCQDPSIACWSLWFPCIRWADTLDTLGIMNFWTAFWIGFLALLLTEATYGFSWLLVVLGLAHWRMRVRKKLRVVSSGWFAWAADLAGFCCCLPCTLAQEARHVQSAFAAEMEAQQ
mmetsp:Transcript_26890/g.52675  ORF Transcript_26890/g.52675 Transcript_26890/m.52675 type:complete len:308 (+) Transcript_26890:69-992(+)